MSRITLNEAMMGSLAALEMVLPPDQKRVVDMGFVEHHGCFFLACLLQTATARAGDFPDATGFECFVNHFHVAVDGGASPFLTAIAVVVSIRAQWARHKTLGTTLRQIITFAEGELTYRCHVLRSGEEWLSPNVDSYDECILVVDI